MKKGLFDSALLFVISFFNIALVIMTAFVGGSQIIYLFPLVFIWIVVPFYIGYLRGAIEIDSIVERTRGWIYLIIGVSSYAAFSTGRVGLSIDGSIIFYFLLLLTGAYFALKLTDWALSIFKKSLSGGEQIALIGAGFAAAFLSYSSISVVITLQILAGGIVDSIRFAMLAISLILFTSGFTGFLVYERTSRVLIHYRSKVKFKSRISKILFIGLFIGLAGLSSNKKFLYSFMSFLSLTLIGSLIGSIEMISFFFLPALVLLVVGLFYFVRYPLSRKNVYAQFRDLMARGRD